MIDSFNFYLGNTPLLVGIPHSGTLLTQHAEDLLCPRAKKLEDTDWHLPILYEFLKEMGVSVIQAKYSRYVIDMNRSRDDKPLYPGATTGLFPNTFFDGESLYLPGKILDSTDKDIYLNEIWDPYHQTIDKTLADIKAEYGYALFWDANSICGEIPYLFEGKLPDLTFGTNDGNSCSSNLIDALCETCEEFSTYSYAVNQHFKGGYNTRHCGQPKNHIQAIQLELAQRTYMDEKTLAYDAKKAAQLEPLLRKLIYKMLEWGNHYGKTAA